MIKKERLVQTTACMLLCITLSVGSTCEAAPLPEEIEISSISEQIVVTAAVCAENEQKELQEEIKRIEEAKKQAEAERIAAEQAEAERVAREQAETELMASIIFCEAGNQSYEGQVAVGAVIMNRVQSPLYPNSIEEVVYQSGQFGPACTGWLDQVRSTSGYTPQTLQAAADAICGADPVEGCLYFDQGGYGLQIGAHYFH